MKTKTLFLILFATGTTGIALAQDEGTPKPDPWAALRQLEGSWEGSIDGRLGTGKGIREYTFVLAGQFLMSRHASVRPQQEKSPEGDHHREIAVFSFDSERQKIVLREFMIEGVVSQSVCDTSEEKVVCVSEHVESGPGIRARLTLEIDGPHSFTEIYELAFPDDKELLHYFTNRWTRRPVLP